MYQLVYFFKNWGLVAIEVGVLKSIILSDSPYFRAWKPYSFSHYKYLAVAVKVEI